MHKNANFTGQPIFSQLLKLVDKSIVHQQVARCNSDRYYKKFKTYTHLVTMLYCIFHKCSSLREVVTGMAACQQRIGHLGLSYSPRRSTFSEANAKRSSTVFEGLYLQLFKKYRQFITDSRIVKSSWFTRMYIIDSTTISLFKEILKNAGRKSVDGKRKGGIKVHAMIKADEDIPCLVKLTAASKHDTPFIKNLLLPKGSIVVFDKAYMDYTQYESWSRQGVIWITRIRSNAVYEVIADKQVSANHKNNGVISDQDIILGHTLHKQVTRTKARLVKYYDNERKKELAFITNSNQFSPLTIAQIYKQRWQIEMLFKRLKQNFPLQYFLGDNENAIRIQIWCVLIADLLLKVVLSKLKRKWSYSNLSSMIRIHLMTYVKLIDFLNNPDKTLLQTMPIQNKGPTLF